ncbi:MAG: aspartate aminotransferase family protein [Mangrovibacterium sp.]
MELFDVYPLFDIAPVRAEGSWVWDNQGQRYLDLYGGHAVISVGHSHPHYVEEISRQLKQIGFYSNSVRIPQQKVLADKLGKLSGFDHYRLFLCNSGAEANENAIKLASFATGRKKVISFGKAFHGRTSAAVAVTDNPKITAPFNKTPHALHLPWGDLQTVKEQVRTGEVAAVIIEGIQGVGGIRIPDPQFLEAMGTICKQHGTLLILDEIQSGYGRSGKFFAFQYSQVIPDLITMAKGMGNGFPMGGVLIHPDLQAWHGMLGTTFGGNYLACAAGIAVLDIMKEEKLVENAAQTGSYLLKKLTAFKGIREVRGRGLMIGMEFDHPVSDIRRRLLFEEKVFTGVSGTNIIRLLPALSLSREQADEFLTKFESVLQQEYH